MTALWSYCWPVFGLGLFLGIFAGAIGFRVVRTAAQDEPSGEKVIAPRLRRKKIVALACGAALSIAAAAIWHGPLGAADRFSTRLERALHSTLVHYEMTQVNAHLHHGPLTRQVVLSGPADDFQRSELARLIDQIPGVRSARWSAGGGGTPLIVEGALVSLLGFLLGLLLAYLAELHRRYNAQWNW